MLFTTAADFAVTGAVVTKGIRTVVMAFMCLFHNGLKKK
jgi:hypothetical protein